MRERLLERLLSPETLGLPPNALTITRPEAHELAAVCMKAAYPRLFPKSLDGESVRLAIRYQDKIKKHPTTKRPRYSLV